MTSEEARMNKINPRENILWDPKGSHAQSFGELFQERKTWESKGKKDKIKSGELKRQKGMI